MAYLEKEIQYLISKYHEDFFDFPFDLIGTEVSLPKKPQEKSLRVDILAKNDDGFVIIELKTNSFDNKAYGCGSFRTV